MDNKTPQVEDGFIRIANDISKSLAKTHLSSYQSRILWVIFVKTYGFQKKRIGFQTVNLLKQLVLNLVM